MSDIDERQIWPIFSGLLPAYGPRVFRRALDFSSLGSYEIDFYLDAADGKFDVPQTVFVDNSANGAPLTIEVDDGTRFSITAPKKSQGVYPLFYTKNAKPIISTTPSDGLIVIVHFCNMPLPLASWSLA